MAELTGNCGFRIRQLLGLRGDDGAQGFHVGNVGQSLRIHGGKDSRFT